jgi:chromate transporter
MTWKPGPDRTRMQTDAAASSRPSAGLLELFLLFSQLGLSSFGGGVSAWIHRAFVEQRGWIGESEFLSALGLSRIMPGANVVNLSVVIGQRLRGAPGAVAAAAGLLAGPSVLVISLALVYRSFGGMDLVSKALEGTAAAAVGLLIAMGVLSARQVLKETTQSSGGALRGGAAMVILIAVFLLVGVLRLPMVPTVLCLAPLSIAVTYFTVPAPPVDQPDDR